MPSSPDLSRLPPPLPGVLSDIARIAGFPAALAIAKRWGGTRLYVPRVDGLAPEHPLVELVGYDQARAIAEYLGGDRPEIARAARYMIRCRNRWIRTDRARGDSHAVLALRYHLTERQIRNILGAPESVSHYDLFDSGGNVSASFH